MVTGQIYIRNLQTAHARFLNCATHFANCAGWQIAHNLFIFLVRGCCFASSRYESFCPWYRKLAISWHFTVSPPDHQLERFQLFMVNEVL